MECQKWIASAILYCLGTWCENTGYHREEKPEMVLSERERTLSTHRSPARSQVTTASSRVKSGAALNYFFAF